MPIKVLMLIHERTELLLDLLVVILILWSTHLLAYCFTGKGLFSVAGECKHPMGVNVSCSSLLSCLSPAFPLLSCYHLQPQFRAECSAQHWGTGLWHPLLSQSWWSPPALLGGPIHWRYHVGTSVFACPLQKQFIWIFNIVCQEADQVKLWITSSSGWPEIAASGFPHLRRALQVGK